MQILGMEVKDEIEEGHEPVGFFIVVKCLKPEKDIKEDGFPYCLFAYSSEEISSWEAEGMVDWVKRVLAQGESDDG